MFGQQTSRLWASQNLFVARVVVIIVEVNDCVMKVYLVECTAYCEFCGGSVTDRLHGV